MGTDIETLSTRVTPWFQPSFDRRLKAGALAVIDAIVPGLEQPVNIITPAVRGTDEIEGELDEFDDLASSAATRMRQRDQRLDAPAGCQRVGALAAASMEDVRARQNLAGRRRGRPRPSTADARSAASPRSCSPSSSRR